MHRVIFNFRGARPCSPGRLFVCYSLNSAPKTSRPKLNFIHTNSPKFIFTISVDDFLFFYKENDFCWIHRTVWSIPLLFTYVLRECECWLLSEGMASDNTWQMYRMTGTCIIQKCQHVLFFQRRGWFNLHLIE